MNPFLLPLWLIGLYRIFRPLDGVNYGFLGLLFLFTLVLMFELHAAGRMLAAVFMPLLAAGAVLVEELLRGALWKIAMRTVVAGYLLVGGLLAFPTSLPLLPFDQVLAFTEKIDFLFPPIKEMNGMNLDDAPLLAGRLGWDEMVQEVARVYADLPAKERAVAGIYTDWYPAAGAIDYLGPQYGLPHAVSGSLTYYLWGSGYSWDVMILLTSKTNPMAVFFDECELKAVVQNDANTFLFTRHIFVCRQPKVSAETIWSSAKLFR